MHSRNEQRTEAKRNMTLSITTRDRYRQSRHKERIRPKLAHGLPTLAANTVEMVVATLQLAEGSSTKDSELHSKSVIDHHHHQTHDDDDDDDDEFIVQLGQEVHAHLPDIVLNNRDQLIDDQGLIRIPNEHRYDNATLLFLDVSGFTSLTEQYSDDAHLGIDQLTRTLNSYFKKLVEEILMQDGDIYKFAGDAILALWTDEQTGPQRALTCALNLQQKCGAYRTDVGVILHLKVALAYGPVRALFVGTEEFKHYLLTGDCVSQVNYCEQLCEPGDIIITPTIYHRLDCQSFPCEFVQVNDDHSSEHILVKYSSLSPSDQDLPSSSMIRNSLDRSVRLAAFTEQSKLCHQ